MEGRTALPKPHSVGPTLAGIAVIRDGDLQTRFSFFPPLQRIRRPHGSMSFFHDDLPNGYLGHPNPLQLGGICHLFHIVHSGKTWVFTVRNEAPTLIHLAFRKMKVTPWFTEACLLYNANRLLGRVAGLSVMFCGQGNSHLGWRAESGILTMNFLVLNRLKSKVHILLQICMNNFQWSYSCISEFT